MKQARIYHHDLNIEGWLQKFKKHLGIKYIKICGKKSSTDHDATENYLEEFTNIISDEMLSPEQVYSADETALY